MTVTDNIADARARDSVYMLRYARSTYRRHANLIDESIADIIRQLNIRSPNNNKLTEARLRAILADMKGISSGLYKGLEGFAIEDLKELAVYQSTATVGAIAAAYPIKMAVNKVSASQIHSAAMARPFDGKFLREWYRDQSYASQQQYKRVIKLGFSQGETIGQISSRVREVGGVEKRHAETIARTAINHHANRAMSETSKANSDIVKADALSATLDGRTTPECIAHDTEAGMGKTYPIGEGPFPPFHMACRTSRYPVTKSWKELGFDNMDEDDQLSERPFVADKRKVKDIPKDQRDSVIGTTTAKSYNDWLKTQPRQFVTDVLGKKKAKLYLDGGVTLDKFVDRKGTSLTLKQINEREWGKAAFEKAGIEL